jgi:Ca2+-binding EF-hand superfamily protein
MLEDTTLFEQNIPFPSLFPKDTDSKSTSEALYHDTLPTQAKPLYPAPPSNQEGNAGAQDQTEPVNPGTPSYDSAGRILRELAYDPAELNKNINKYFRKADVDKDGFVSADEAQNVQGELSRKERLLAEIVASGGAIVQTQNNDEWGSESSGVTRDDIKAAFENWSDHDEEKRNANRVVDYLPREFDKMDADGNGFLSKDELNEDQLSQSGSLMFLVDRAMGINFLERNYDAVKSNADDGSENNLGISLQDIYRVTDSFYEKEAAEQKALDAYFYAAAIKPVV